jgi:hypothetical protein
MKVRLWRGPLHNVELDLPAGTKLYHIGKFFTYEETDLTGPDGRHLFAKRPRSSAKRQFIKLARQMTGRDQRLYEPGKPAMSKRVAHGRGAAKRAARRALEDASDLEAAHEAYDEYLQGLSTDGRTT